MSIFVFLVLPLCAAFPQDLTDKMFTFPDQTNIAHVKLNTTYDTFKAVTVCLKSFTDLQRAHVLFSMTNPANNHAFAIFKISSTDSFYLHVASYYLYFSGHQYKMNSWNHICATWDSKNGLAQMWVDGQPTTRKLIRPEETLKGSPIIMIGQWQTSRGGFETSQSFVGMMSDVHMWDYVLPSCEIQRYMNNRHFTPGNIINWRALEFDTVGKVILEDIGCIY